MSLMFESKRRFSLRARVAALAAALVCTLTLAAPLLAQQPAPVATAGQEAAQAERGPGGEASLVLPDLGTVDVGGFSSRSSARCPLAGHDGWEAATAGSITAPG